MEFRHEPVLLQEVLQWMNVRSGGVYCDGTLGGGGHSEAILKASGGTARLYGIDRDENAIRAASERLRITRGLLPSAVIFTKRNACWRKRGQDSWTVYCLTWACPVRSLTLRNAGSATTRTRRWTCVWTGARG